MELRHLKYFITVAEQQSFTKAAEKLFIAQPPLSRQIQNLENEFGILLFERGSRPLKMTEAGQFFYHQAIKLLEKAEEVKSLTKRMGLVERTVRIGFVGSLLYGYLSRIVYLYRQRYPKLKVELIEMTTTHQIPALKAGQIDVGFGRLRVSDPEINRILLRKERLMLAVHASHPFAQKKNGVYLADLLEQAIFLYPNHTKPNFSTQIRNLFSEYSLEPKNLHEVREIQLALGLVAAGEGVCIVPESARTLQLMHLHYISILDENAVSPVFMATRCMDEREDIRSLFDCIYQVYDLEAIQYDRASF